MGDTRDALDELLRAIPIGTYLALVVFVIWAILTLEGEHELGFTLALLFYGYALSLYLVRRLRRKREQNE